MIENEILNKKLAYYSSNSSEDILSFLKTTPDGLTAEEANERLKKFGRNTIKDEVKLHIVLQYLANFKNPLILILLVVSIISFLTRGTVEAIIILCMVFISVTLNFFQEYKANKAAQELRNRIATNAIVIRGGQKINVSTSDICIGDILVFSAGDLIPADCRVIDSKDLFINQSSLTGESFPVEKFNHTLKDTETELSQLTNILFHGTSVVTGSVRAVVVKTGGQTEYGKIAENLIGAEEDNEFTKGIGDFSVLILKVVIFFVLFIFLVNSLLKQNVLESLMFSVAVAVGLTPEFLPMIMSVTMGKGSLNMAKKGVIVKKLSAIPSFGSIDVLCTDKTGTLTEDKIKLVTYTDLAGAHSDKVLLHAYLNSLYQTGVNNPMDDAVVNYKKLDVSEYSKKDEIPFDFDRKRVSIVAESKAEGVRMITKGAPEEVFKICKSFDLNGVIHTLSADKIDGLIKQYLDLSADGYRVLAIATKKVTEIKNIYEPSDETDLVLLGYIAFLDPAKVDVKDALDRLGAMGIEVKILTGDNDIVAEKICRDVQIKIKGVLLGHDLEKMTEEELKHKVNDITLFARVSPDDKLRIIRALKANGHVVGYMGDGINDAPSLKASDVGISVSNAVDVAKESADIVLTRKSLHQLIDGVVEGRKTFGNTMKYIMMGISSNFGNMFSVLGAVIFLPFLPMLPIQILLNNFLYDFAQLTIPTDNVDSDFLQKPKRWSIKYIRNFMFIFGPISSFYDFLTYFVMFMLFKNMPGAFQTGWFMESLATQTLVIYFIRTRKIPFIQSSPSKYLVISTLATVAIGWFIASSPFGSIFGFSVLPLYVILYIVAIVVAYLLTVELGKRLFFKKYFDLQ